MVYQIGLSMYLGRFFFFQIHEKATPPPLVRCVAKNSLVRRGLNH